MGLASRHFSRIGHAGGRVVLPVVWTNEASALLGSLLFGGTFMGIATLALTLGRQCAPFRSQQGMALMTASFGLGQMIGPLGAGALIRVTHRDAPTLLASGIVLWAAVGRLGMTRRPASGHPTMTGP